MAATQVLAEANRARAAAGIAALVDVRELSRAAEDYAQELAARGVLDHTSPVPGRETMAQRIEAAGATWVTVAENLFRHSGAGGDQVALRAVTSWLASPGHRANLLDARYTQSGVGIARDRRGDWYVVQLYVRPRAGR